MFMNQIVKFYKFNFKTHKITNNKYMREYILHYIIFGYYYNCNFYYHKI